LLPDPVCASTEALSRNRQIVGLVLQRIQTFATLRDLADILPHHPDGVIDLL
jgi:hypothetical protein